MSNNPPWRTNAVLRLKREQNHWEKKEKQNNSSLLDISKTNVSIQQTKQEHCSKLNTDNHNNNKILFFTDRLTNPVLTNILILIYHEKTMKSTSEVKLILSGQTF